MIAPYDGLTAARLTDRWLRKILKPTNEEFSYFANSGTAYSSKRNVPDSPDPDMKGCRIDLRKKADSQ